MVKLASFAKNSEKLEALVCQICDGNESLMTQLQISQFLDSITWDAFQLVIQRSEMLNNMAYAYAKDDIMFENALTNVTSAIELVTTLEQAVKDKECKDWLCDWKAIKAFEFDTRGWIYFRLHRLGEALIELKEACNLVPNDADIHYHLARVFTEKLQVIWQEKQDAKTHPELSEDMRQTLRHWHEAKRNGVDPISWSQGIV